ncbi:hypothetical protein EV383_5550 [Pseudonocardia sediminis]|uniref:Uncharacterized protein n=1 Tax=Pseudonocardia sediminis TaxID=1397368 RepID=A0A4Q7V2L2_PSEST|nr:hypothetical protein [Pseudonocardia sediminis]RZT88606.1 hypothetical protein EV383_5550 [Pseudonocardia sediminis]
MTSSTGQTTTGTTDIREFGHELWSYLTGKGAVVEYAFDNLSVEVPKTTGPDSPRATWKMHGTVRVRTSDNDNTGSVTKPAGNGNGAA